MECAGGVKMFLTSPALCYLYEIYKIIVSEFYSSVKPCGVETVRTQKLTPQGVHARNLRLLYDFLWRPKNGGYFFCFYFTTLYPILPAWTFRGVSALAPWGFLGAYRQRVVSLVPEGQSVELNVYVVRKSEG